MRRFFVFYGNAIYYKAKIHKVNRRERQRNSWKKFSESLSFLCKTLCNNYSFIFSIETALIQ